MKSYVVVNKTANETLGSFKTKEEASEYVIEFIRKNNEDLYSDDDGFLYVFDFDVREVEIQDLNTYMGACKYLGLLETEGSFDNVFTRNKKHVKALVALAQLFTVAEAWNKEDGFVIDFSNKKQVKFFPWFDYNKDTGRFVCTRTSWTGMVALLGSRICFSNSERALNFGKTFESLYNDFLLFDE